MGFSVFLVPTRRVGTPTARAAGRNPARRAELAFPRGAWERGTRNLMREKTIASPASDTRRLNINGDESAGQAAGQPTASSRSLG